MSEPLIIGKAKNKYYVLCNGNVTEVQSDDDLDTFYASVMVKCKAGILEFDVNKGIKSTTFISTSQHLTISIMVESEYIKWQISMRQQQMGR